MSRLVPDRQREHSTQQRKQALRPLVLVEVDQYLGIARGPQGVPTRIQPMPEGLEVVDFAVEDDPDRAILVGKRLMASLDVDDGEPPKSERCMLVAVDPLIIGPAMNQSLDHLVERAVAEPSAAVRPGRATDPAHGIRPECW